MAEHVSALALDTLAAELPVDLPTSSHVATCAECRTKLDALKAERVALMQDPRFNSLLSQLTPATAARKGIPRWVPVLLAMAAALVLIVGLLPRADGTILKGAPTVELLNDGRAVTTARVGERLAVAIGGAGHDAVVIFTIGPKGEVADFLTLMPVPAGARVHVGGPFDVTPGSLALFACFGEDPLPVDTLRKELSMRAAKAEKPLEAAPPDGCAKTKLEVLP